MILSRKQVEVWKNSTIPIDGYGPLVRNLLDTIDDLLADRPAPSGEAPQAGEDSFALTARIGRECHKAFDGICSSFATSHCEELISAHDTAIRTAERNRARREAMEEAANLVENSVDENTAGILTIRSDIGDKIRALAAAPQGMEKKA